jgi:uncharacterized protein (UPF0264 family)
VTGFLASVTSVEEARMVLNEADIIDLKNPAQGALGALPYQVVEAVVRFVDGRKLVSATVGDLPMTPAALSAAVVAMAETGVDIVKVGFFGHENLAVCAKALGELTGSCKMVAVLFADQRPEFWLLDTLAEAGFHGAMLDTANKASGSLTGLMSMHVLHDFVDKAKSRNLLTGLAGSLREKDIADLSEMGADYLGFRGALCLDHFRQEVLQSAQVSRVSRLLREYNSSMVSDVV